jgi:hypothetical protein
MDMGLRLRLSRFTVAAILVITAVPAGFRNPWTNYFPHWHAMFDFGDAVVNILLFIPFGLFFKPNTSVLKVTGLGGVLSASIELAQLFFLRRNTQPSDLICNTLGALVGALIGKAIGIRSDNLSWGRRLGAGAVLAASVWAGAYLAFGSEFPPYSRRGSIPTVALLCALGCMGLVGPATQFSKVVAGLTGGVIGAAALLPVTPLGLLPTFSLGLVFGLAAALCATSDDDRRLQPHRVPAQGDAVDLHSV